MNYRTLEPKWLPYQCIPRFTLPQGLVNWLLTSDSLTARLRLHCKQHFHVNVLSHHWQHSCHSEMEILKIAKQPTLIRQVELMCADNILVYARSVFPRSSLVGKNTVFRQLGNIPMGEILYRDPQLQRSNFEIAKLRAGHTDYELALRNSHTRPEVLWARRCIFIINRYPILVSEIFLPILYQTNHLLK